MAAPKNNTYWKLAKGFAVGKNKLYTQEELWKKALEYMEWLDRYPLKEQKVFANGKRITVNKMRAATITGFCLFAEICSNTFDNYSKDEAYVSITKRIRDLIFSQKFEGAAADLLNSNIIAREMGLVDTQKIQGDPDNPLKHEVEVKIVSTGKRIARSEEEVEE